MSKFILRRYCLLGLNVVLTEKFESNSKPMRIHISHPCKELLPPQYKTEERTEEPELTEKVLIVFVVKLKPLLFLLSFDY